MVPSERAAYETLNRVSLLLTWGQEAREGRNTALRAAGRHALALRLSTAYRALCRAKSHHDSAARWTATAYLLLADVLESEHVDIFPTETLEYFRRYQERRDAQTQRIRHLVAMLLTYLVVASLALIYAWRAGIVL